MDGVLPDADAGESNDGDSALDQCGWRERDSPRGRRLVLERENDRLEPMPGAGHFLAEWRCITERISGAQIGTIAGAKR